MKMDDQMISERTSRFSWASLLLLIIPMLMIFFYGVVGKDKTFNLAPLTVIGLGIVTVALGRRAVAAKFEKQVMPVSLGLFLLYLFYVTCRTPFSAVPYESKMMVYQLGLIFGAYTVWGASLTSYRLNRWLLGGLILLALLASFYGIMIHLKSPESILWTERYTDHYLRGETARLASLYICPNHFAHILQMLAPFCLVMMFIPQSGLILRIFAGYSLISFFPTLYFTESRAGFLGTIGALAVTALLLALRRSKMLFLILIIAIPLVIGGGLFAAWNISDVFQRRMKPLIEYLVSDKDDGIASTEAADFRPTTWMDTIETIQEKPATGYGGGTFRYVFPEHRKRFKGTRYVTGYPHNEYLQIIWEYGLVGFGLFALAWIYGLIRILRFSLTTSNKHHALMAMAFLGTAAGTMFHSLFDYEMYIFPNAMIFAFLAGITVAPIIYQKKMATKKRQKRNTTGWQERFFDKRLLFAGMALIYLVGTGFCIQMMSSAVVRAFGDIAREKQSTEKAKSLYELAVKIDPSNWRAYKNIGLMLFDQRYYTLDQDKKRSLALEEHNWFKQAVKYNPYDAETVLGYAKSKLFVSKNPLLTSAKEQFEQEALELFRKACSYRKYNDFYWWLFGVELRVLGHYEEALEVFEYAAKIKNSRSIQANIKWIQQQLALKAAGDLQEDSTEPINYELEINNMLKLLDEMVE